MEQINEFTRYAVVPVPGGPTSTESLAARYPGFALVAFAAMSSTRWRGRPMGPANVRACRHMACAPSLAPVSIRALGFGQLIRGQFRKRGMLGSRSQE